MNVWYLDRQVITRSNIFRWVSAYSTTFVFWRNMHRQSTELIGEYIAVVHRISVTTCSKSCSTWGASEWRWSQAQQHTFQLIGVCNFVNDTPSVGMPPIHRIVYRIRMWTVWWPVCAFSALTLLVGRQEGHPACKNWVVGCWSGCLSGARCRLAYGPADAAATHCLLLQ